MTIQSETAIVRAGRDEVFRFLCDMNNLQHLMPETVSDWQSSSDTCSFKIRGLGKVSFLLKENRHPGEIIFVNGEDSPFPFTLRCLLEGSGEGSCSARTVFEGEINPVLALLLEKPLSRFFNSLVNNLPGKFGAAG